MEDSKEIKDIVLTRGLEETPGEEISDEGIQKTKPRKPYVLTEARKAQFDKARLVRQSNIESKKKIQEEKDEIYNNIKADLLKKKDKNNVKKQKRQIKK